jgi:hypothetical protein
MRCVYPQSVMRLVVILTDQKPNEIMKVLIGYALEVHVAFKRMPGEFRQCMHVHFSRSYRQGLEFEVKTHRLIFRAFTPSSWREHKRRESGREYPRGLRDL